MDGYGKKVTIRLVFNRLSRYDFQPMRCRPLPLKKGTVMPDTREKILIAEDDPKTARLVSLYLEKEGFQTLIAGNGRAAIEIASAHPLCFVILDIMLPQVDGWEVCRIIRSTSDVPILMLTAREDEVDRIMGLTLGADDYVVKPFSPRELVARVKAILRRGPLKTRLKETLFTAGALVMDTKRYQVSLNHVPVPVTPHEYKLLHALMSARGRVLSRHELLTRLYPNGEAIVIDRVVDVHIGKLRQKIETDPSRPRHILTVRGIGYRFSTDE
jgi:DNA-binding response OmpR family regulator